MKKHYVDNGNGTVTDTRTGLMWLQDGNDYNGGKEQMWKNAVSGCKKFNFAGHKDWRLPTAHELFSLVDFGKKEFPLIDKIFKNTRYWYWTATNYVPSTTYAMIVGFQNGYVTNLGKTTAYYVRPVRAGS